MKTAYTIFIFPFLTVLLGPIQDTLAQKMRIRILQSVPLLAKLSENKLSKLAGVMRVQQFNDGAYIIRQGIFTSFSVALISIQIWCCNRRRRI